MGHDNAHVAETRIDRLHGEQAANEQSGLCEQHQRHGELATTKAPRILAEVPAALFRVVWRVKPALKTVDDAVRRRLHLVPFTVSIPEAERDPGLKQALR